MDVVVAEVQAREEGQVLQAIHVKRGDLWVVEVRGGGGGGGGGHQLQTRYGYYICTWTHHTVQLQWNLSIVDTTRAQLAVLNTVEPLYSGHHQGPAGCPEYSGTSL